MSSDYGASFVEVVVDTGEEGSLRKITSSSSGAELALVVEGADPRGTGNAVATSRLAPGTNRAQIACGDEAVAGPATSNRAGGNVWTTVEPSCTDDDAWTTTRNGKSVGCDWVEAWAPRCQAKGTMPSTKGKVYARYLQPRRNLPSLRNPVSAVAAFTEYPSCGRAAAATRLCGRPPGITRKPSQVRVRQSMRYAVQRLDVMVQAERPPQDASVRVQRSRPLVIATSTRRLAGAPGSRRRRTSAATCAGRAEPRRTTRAPSRAAGTRTRDVKQRTRATPSRGRAAPARSTQHSSVDPIFPSLSE